MKKLTLFVFSISLLASVSTALAKNDSLEAPFYNFTGKPLIQTYYYKNPAEEVNSPGDQQISDAKSIPATGDYGAYFRIADVPNIGEHHPDYKNYKNGYEYDFRYMASYPELKTYDETNAPTVTCFYQIGYNNTNNDHNCYTKVTPEGTNTEHLNLSTACQVLKSQYDDRLWNGNHGCYYELAMNPPTIIRPSTEPQFHVTVNNEIKGDSLYLDTDSSENPHTQKPDNVTFTTPPPAIVTNDNGEFSGEINNQTDQTPESGTLIYYVGPDITKRCVFNYTYFRNPKTLGQTTCTAMVDTSNSDSKDITCTATPSSSTKVPCEMTLTVSNGKDFQATVDNETDQQFNVTRSNTNNVNYDVLPGIITPNSKNNLFSGAPQNLSSAATDTLQYTSSNDSDQFCSFTYHYQINNDNTIKTCTIDNVNLSKDALFACSATPSLDNNTCSFPISITDKPMFSGTVTNNTMNDTAETFKLTGQNSSGFNYNNDNKPGDVNANGGSSAFNGTIDETIKNPLASLTYTSSSGRQCVFNYHYDTTNNKVVTDNANATGSVLCQEDTDTNGALELVIQDKPTVQIPIPNQQTMGIKQSQSNGQVCTGGGGAIYHNIINDPVTGEQWILSSNIPFQTCIDGAQNTDSFAKTVTLNDNIISVNYLNGDIVYYIDGLGDIVDVSSCKLNTAGDPSGVNQLICYKKSS